MSRTHRGGKGAGYDYWGKRILSGTCGYGKYVKKQTNKRERLKDKARLKNGEEDMEKRRAF